MRSVDLQIHLGCLEDFAERGATPHRYNLLGSQARTKLWTPELLALRGEKRNLAGKVRRIIFLCLLCLAPGVRARADESDLVQGLFWSPDRDAKIQFYREQSQILGKIVWVLPPGKDHNNPDQRLKSRDLLGLIIIRGFIAAEPDVWREGTVYDPDSGQTYSGKIWFESADHDRLYLRGFVGLSLFGRTQILQRVAPGK